MIFSPLRLISWVFGLLVIGIPLAVIALFVVAITGSPGSCEAEGRPISFATSQALSFQQKWDQMSATLDAGSVSTIILDEQEVTSRARLWVEEANVPVSDLIVCFTVDGGAASGKIDIPFFPGDVDVLIRATVDLRGEHPEITIEELDMGGLPSLLTDVVKGRITSLIEDQAEKITLSHDYGLSFDEGVVTASGQP